MCRQKKIKKFGRSTKFFLYFYFGEYQREMKYSYFLTGHIEIITSFSAWICPALCVYSGYLKLILVKK